MLRRSTQGRGSDSSIIHHISDRAEKEKKGPKNWNKGVLIPTSSLGAAHRTIVRTDKDETEPLSPLWKKVERLRDFLERAQAEQFVLLLKKPEDRTSSENDRLETLRIKIARLEVKVETASQKAKSATVEGIVRTVGILNASHNSHVFGARNANLATNTQSDNSEFNRAQLLLDLELAALQEKHLEDLLSGIGSCTRSKKKNKEKKKQKPGANLDVASIKARLSDKKSEIEDMKQRLLAHTAEIEGEDLDHQRSLETFKRSKAVELKKAIIGDEGHSIGADEERTSADVISEIAIRIRERNTVSMIQRLCEENEVKAKFRAERELRVLAVKNKTLREIDARKKQSKNLERVSGHIYEVRSKALLPLQNAANRIQRIASVLKPGLTHAHRQMTEKLESAFLDLRESERLEENLEQTLEAHNLDYEKWARRAQYQPINSEGKDSKSEIDQDGGAKFDPALMKSAAKLRDAAESRINSTAAELRKLKLRNSFAEDYLSRVEAIVIRLTVLKELLEIIPGEKMEKQIRVDFLQSLNTVLELILFKVPEDSEPSTTIAMRVDGLEERILRQCIKLAKLEASPMTASELENAKAASETVLDRFRSLRITEQKRLKFWECICEKHDAERKAFTAEVARVRIARSLRIIKTIDLSVNALTVVLNNSAVSAKV